MECVEFPTIDEVLAELDKYADDDLVDVMDTQT